MSVTPMAKVKQDEKYLNLIRSLPCLACGRFPTEELRNEAAHVRYSDARAGKPITGFGLRPPSQWTLPLCHKCHIHGQHLSGERVWWAEQSIDPIRLCQALYKCWKDGQKSRLSWPQLRDDMINVIGSGWVHG